ncbi:hypothetical protein MAR_010257, partial [Mya arenaria]
MSCDALGPRRTTFEATHHTTHAISTRHSMSLRIACDISYVASECRIWLCMSYIAFQGRHTISDVTYDTRHAKRQTILHPKYKATNDTLPPKRQGIVVLGVCLIKNETIHDTEDDGLMRRGHIFPPNPNLSKLYTLSQSCKARADYIGSQILANKELIKDGSFHLPYHRNCRATYQSPYHQSFSSSLKKTEINNNENVTITRRSSSIAFDWKSQCFICGEKCDTIRDPSFQRPNSSCSMVETSIDAILKAAEIKNDTSLILWLWRLAITERKAVLPNNQINSNNAQKFRFRSAAFKLKEGYADSIMTQKKLDLVCSKDVTVGEALRDYKDDEDIEIDLATDESIVHKAVCVLRRRNLRNTETLDSEYFSVDEMSLSSQKKFVDPLLYKMI